MRYDPRVAYYERMNINQRRGLSKIANHQFSNSIGGCSANYRC